MNAIGNDDAARWQIAKQIRCERPRWVVIWYGRNDEYRARPLFRAPLGTVVAAASPEELTAQMDAVEQAARSGTSVAR
jgi:hypothetical protein